MLPRRDYAKKIPPLRPDPRPDVMWTSPTRINSIPDYQWSEVPSQADCLKPGLLRSLVWETKVKDALRRYSRTTESYKVKHPERIKPQNSYACCVAGEYLHRRDIAMTPRHPYRYKKGFTFHRDMPLGPIATRSLEEEKAALEPIQMSGAADVYDMSLLQ